MDLQQIVEGMVCFLNESSADALLISNIWFENPIK
jgi:hypothetical protein